MEQCKLLQKNVWVILELNIFKSRISIYVVDRRVSERDDTHDSCQPLQTKNEKRSPFFREAWNACLIFRKL